MRGSPGQCGADIKKVSCAFTKSLPSPSLGNVDSQAQSRSIVAKWEFFSCFISAKYRASQLQIFREGPMGRWAMDLVVETNQLSTLH